MNAQFGTDLAQGTAPAVQVGCTLNVHGRYRNESQPDRLATAETNVPARPCEHDEQAPAPQTIARRPSAALQNPSPAIGLLVWSGVTHSGMIGRD
jgi:hypothetical protein